MIPQVFRTFYSHGLMSSNISDKRCSLQRSISWRINGNNASLKLVFVCFSEIRQPFMLFGKHSSSDDLENYSFNFASESHQVRNTGPQGSAAPHMVRNRQQIIKQRIWSHCRYTGITVTLSHVSGSLPQ